MTPKAKHWIYLACGWLCTGLGILGAFLPLLPTTPFLLLALWAFSKSSPRLHAWLYHHPRFGRALQHWSDNGSISAGAKAAAVGAMALSAVILYLATENAVVVFVHLVVMCLVALYILSRPSVHAETSAGVPAAVEDPPGS